MSTTDGDVIADALAEVVANESDPVWEAWTRDRMRMQGRLHDQEALLSALRLRLGEREQAARVLAAEQATSHRPPGRPTCLAPSGADGFEQAGGEAEEAQGRGPRPESRWLDTKLVAAYFRVSRRTITNWMQDTPAKVQPWIKVGSTIRWDRDGLDLWLGRLGKRRK